MKLFKKPDGSVHAFELDGSQDVLIETDMVPLSDYEITARSMRLAVDAVRLQISSLESQITPRRLREAILTGDSSFIKNLDDEIRALRPQLTPSRN